MLKLHILLVILISSDATNGFAFIPAIVTAVRFSEYVVRAFEFAIGVEGIWDKLINLKGNKGNAVTTTTNPVTSVGNPVDQNYTNAVENLVGKFLILENKFQETINTVNLYYFSEKCLGRY